MTIGCKKFIVEWAGESSWIDSEQGWKDLTLKLRTLVKAMWAINREGKWIIEMYHFGVQAYTKIYEIECRFVDYNNSEQEALMAALEYIHKESK